MPDYYEDLANEMGNTDRYIQPDEEDEATLNHCYCGDYHPCPHGHCIECDLCDTCEDSDRQSHERAHAPGEI